jgi:hypothetical protein
MWHFEGIAGDEGETLPFVLIGKENTRKEERGSQVSLVQRKTKKKI